MNLMTTHDMQLRRLPLTELIGDPSNSPPCIVGIDTSQVPVRVVVTLLREELSFVPEPIQETKFTCLREFTRYWTEEVSTYADRVAIPDDYTDPFNVRAWLQTQQWPVEIYPWTSYRSHLSAPDFRDIRLDEPYARAYALAVYASYRPRSAAIAREAWAKVFEAQDLLTDLQHTIHRLVAALPDPRVWQPDDVPF